MQVAIALFLESCSAKRGRNAQRKGNAILYFGRSFLRLFSLRKNSLYSAVLCFLLTTAPSAARPIDDFTSGPVDITFTDLFSITQEGLSETAVAGGIRKYGLTLNTPLFLGSVARTTIDTSAGTFRITTTDGALEGYSLDYGFGLENNLNLDLSAFNAFRIDVISASAPGIISFSFLSGDNEAPRRTSGSQIRTLPASDTPYSILLPFDGFSRDADYSDVDFISIGGGGGGPNGFDLILGGIFAVPEPSTAALMLAASISLFSRRRFRYR